MSEKNNDNVIFDNLGRKIELKEINGKARVAFFRALGPRDAGNVGVTMEYWNTMAVHAIDDKPYGTFKALIDIELLYEQLEKSNALQLIDQWLINKAQEKQADDIGDGEKK